MRGVQTIDFDPANVAVTGIASEVVVPVGTSTVDLAITALTQDSDVARQITFEDESAAGDNPLATIEFIGTDADGNPQRETITDIEDNAAVKTTTGYYATVDEILVGTDVEFEMTLNIGTNGVMASKALMLDKYAINAPLVVQELTGTMAWSIETTVERLDNSKNQSDVVWTADADHSGLSAGQQQNLADWPVTYARVITTSYTDTAELALRVSQGY